MIRSMFARFSPPRSREDPAALRAEIDRLQAQNDKLRAAMRHCTDCEYRIEVITRRSNDGLTASGD